MYSFTYFYFKTLVALKFEVRFTVLFYAHILKNIKYFKYNKFVYICC